MSKEQKVAVVNETPDNFIAQAVASGASIEVLERLIALQERVNANKAREAFVKAMSAFQAECPVVDKTKAVKNKSGQVTYHYAPLDTIINQVGKTIAKHNLAYTFDISNDDKELTATCKVTHVDGHSEIFTFKVPIGSESYMTEVQKFGARATFAKRNAFCNAFGIATGDEDTDATQTDAEKKPLDKRAQIAFALKSLGFTPAGKSAEEVKDKVLKLTELELNEQNADGILERLHILIDEQNEDKSTD
jgi:hypothetical protein